MPIWWSAKPLRLSRPFGSRIRELGAGDPDRHGKRRSCSMAEVRAAGSVAFGGD